MNQGAGPVAGFSNQQQHVNYPCQPPSQNYAMQPGHYQQQQQQSMVGYAPPQGQYIQQQQGQGQYIQQQPGHGQQQYGGYAGGGQEAQMMQQFAPGQQYPAPATGQYVPNPQGGQGQHYPPPVPMNNQMQPSGGRPPMIWMERPSHFADSSCPPGLEYLTQIDQILVQQQIELLEVFTNWETKNKYQIKNSLGQQIYFAAEESDMCGRQCCGPQRAFVMHVTDNMGNEVIRVNRDFKCCAGNCYCLAGVDCCAQEMVAEAPPGVVCGSVKQTTSCIEPRYDIRDASGNTVLQIQGPACICQGPCCTWDQEFKVFSANMEQEVGKICKQWSGLMREYFTDADNFGVSFPMDLDVRLKATMIGAVFLIDFMFFENNAQNQNN